MQKICSQKEHKHLKKEEEEEEERRIIINSYKLVEATKKMKPFIF